MAVFSDLLPVTWIYGIPMPLGTKKATKRRKRISWITESEKPLPIALAARGMIFPPPLAVFLQSDSFLKPS
jgi:hypothetical protein